MFLDNKDTSLTLIDVEDNFNTLPEYKKAQIQEERLKSEVILSRSAYLPSINLHFNYGSFYSDSNIIYNFKDQWDNNKNYGVSLSLSIPIFNGFTTRYAVRRAQNLYEQSKVRTTIEKNNSIKILSQANHDLISSSKKMNSAFSALRYSHKSFEADQLKFEYGKISLSELLLTQKEFYNSRAESIKAKYEYLYNLGVIEFYKSNDFNL